MEATCRSIGPPFNGGYVDYSRIHDLSWNVSRGHDSNPSRGKLSSIGQDLLVAYSPEREDPGNIDFETQTIPKLVGGQNPAVTERAVTLYRKALDLVIPVDTMEIAELAKLFENIFRAVNIALVNEMKVLCDRMDVDVWKVIDAAGTKPFGFMKFTPGPGIGGHCIPVDPFYLTWKAKEYGINTRFIELAGEVNRGMPQYVIDRLREALSEDHKALTGAKVLVLGVAYKKGVEDMRESPSLDLIELLLKAGADVRYHDPFVPSLPQMRKHNLALGLRPLTETILSESDAVLIATDHDEVDYQYVMNQAHLVVDTRNAVRSQLGSQVVGKARLVHA